MNLGVPCIDRSALRETPGILHGTPSVSQGTPGVFPGTPGVFPGTPGVLHGTTRATSWYTRNFISVPVHSRPIVLKCHNTICVQSYPQICFPIVVLIVCNQLNNLKWQGAAS